jgi:hypothetical protein
MRRTQFSPRLDIWNLMQALIRTPGPGPFAICATVRREWSTGRRISSKV